MTKTVPFIRKRQRFVNSCLKFFSMTVHRIKPAVRGLEANCPLTRLDKRGFIINVRQTLGHTKDMETSPPGCLTGLCPACVPLHGDSSSTVREDISEAGIALVEWRLFDKPSNKTKRIKSRLCRKSGGFQDREGAVSKERRCGANCQVLPHQEIKEKSFDMFREDSLG